MPRAAQAQGAAGLHARGHAAMPRESEAHAKRKSSSVRTSAFCRRAGTSAAKAAVSVARMRCTSFSSWMSSRAASSRSAETEAGSTNSVDPLAEASTTVPGQVAPPLALQRQDQAAAALGDIPLHEPVRVRAQQGLELAAHPLLRGGALAAQGVQRGGWLRSNK